MKYLLWSLGVFSAVLLVIVIIRSPATVYDPDRGVEKTIIVGPVTDMCESVGVRRCLQVKENSGDAWQNHFGEIVGFEHIVGKEYLLKIREESVSDVPAGASAIRWVLVETLEQKEVPYVAIMDPIDQQEIQMDQAYTVKGVGRGLFEGNVIIQVGTKIEMIDEYPTTMATSEIGGEGTWEADVAITLPEDTAGIISAFSPSPRDGESGHRYSVPVVYVSDGQEATFEGTDWRLSQMMKEDISGFVEPAADTNVLFDGERLGGISGCNNYNTSYELTGENKIKISEQIASTLKLCPEPIMEQERLYLTQLSRASEYNVKGTELLLMNELGESLLIFTAHQDL
ncbi:META domain-containing protein [Patescibacteria group bacterium]